MGKIRVTLYIDEETRFQLDELYIKSIRSGERLNKCEILGRALQEYYEKNNDRSV